MSHVRRLRALVNQRLSAAAEEICALFERTIAEYEEELDRQRRLMQVNAAVFPVNVKKQWGPGVDQEHPKPTHTKEEQDDLWTHQEGEQLKQLETAGVKFPLTSVSVKSEEDDDHEKSRSWQLHRTQTVSDAEHFITDANGADHGGPEKARNFDPGRHLQAWNITSCSSEAEGRNDGSREPPSVFSTLKNSEVAVSDIGCKKSFGCSECGKQFGSRGHLQIHVKCHTGEKTSACPFCGKKFTKNSNLTTHLRVHTGEKPFTCSVCNTSFSLRCTLVNHMRVHTGEKPFSCSVCSKRFSKKANLTTHMALHTEEKPFKCSICDRRFTWHSQIKNHKCVVDHRATVTSRQRLIQEATLFKVNEGTKTLEPPLNRTHFSATPPPTMTSVINI